MKAWEREELRFLRNEYHRLQVENKSLLDALKRRNKDFIESENRFVRECLSCELRKANKSPEKVSVNDAEKEIEPIDADEPLIIRGRVVKPPTVYEQIVQGLQEAIEYEKREGNQ